MDLGEQVLGFDWMLNPYDYETFRDTLWTQKPLHIGRDDRQYYEALLSEDDLDFAFALAAKSADGLEVLNGERSFFPRNFHIAMEALRRGHSLRLNALQRFLPHVAQLQIQLEQRLSCPINVNLYMTPGEGQALKRHFDTHDVFVLQISGEKKWHLFDSTVAEPLEFLPLIRGESRREMRRLRLPKDMTGSEACTQTDEFIMKSGELLYLPRGHWHEARGQEGTVSCHLTVGTQIYTYLDLLTVAVGQAAQRVPALRSGLAAGFASSYDAQEIARQQIQSIIADLAVEVRSGEAVSTLLELFIRSRSNYLENRSLSLKPSQAVVTLQLNTQLQKRNGIIIGVDKQESEISLKWLNKSTEFPLKFESACRFVTEVSHFSPNVIPGLLDDADRLMFAERLFENGVVHLSRSRDLQKTPNADSLSGWLPIKIRPLDLKVRWADFRGVQLTEPFFKQTIHKLTKSNPTHLRTSPIKFLQRLPDQVPPSGFIFHISRCGSTLVSNALRHVSNSSVISEAEVISQAIVADREMHYSNEMPTEISDSLIQSVMKGFQAYSTQCNSHLIVKFTSWNILFLDYLRRFWPEVPCLVVVRNPLEVMVSVLEKGTGWMNWQSADSISPALAEITSLTESNTSPEQFCAQMICKFLDIGYRNLGDNCRVIDYADITPASVVSIAEYMNLRVNDADCESIRSSMFIYSKDLRSDLPFQPDSAAKRQRATDLVSKEASTCQSIYEDLATRSRMTWGPKN